MLPRGVAARLAAVYGALFVLTLGPLLALTVVVTSGWLETALDDHLNTVGNDIANRLDGRTEPRRVVEQMSAPSQLIELWTTDRRAAVRSSLLEHRPLRVPGGTLLPDRPVIQTVPSNPGRLRVLAFPLPPNELGLGWAMIATPIPNLGQQTQGLVLLLLVMGAVALGLSLVATWLVARWLTRPLRELAIAVGQNADTEVAAIAVDPRASQEVAAVAEAIQRFSERHQARLERERAFFADSSHVLRTPLAALQGNIDLLEHAVGEDERREATEGARSAVRSIARTVSGLLLLSRRESPVSERDLVDLTRLVREVEVEFRRAWPDRPLTCEVDGRLEVIGDQHGLREAIEAVAENAARYTPAGGDVQLRCYRENDSAVVEVSDDGIGLSPDEARRATERFFRGYRARGLAPGGTGLGLAIAQRRVQMDGGQLTIEPGPGGRGAVARIRLPLSSELVE